MIERPSVSVVQRPYVVLAMLLLVYIFNFVDRQILAILAGSIQAELHLSDTQMGLLGGIAFALLYSTLSLPLAWLADRRGRSRVIAASLAVWSGFTALCGMAQGFWHIFLFRLGVGVGEAGGVAPSYALIAESFPERRRAFAMAIFALGVPLGSALGVLAGGYIAARVNWRIAFLVLGGVGLLLAPLFRFVVRDRVRAEPQAKAPGFARVAGNLLSTPVFWLLSCGAASGSVAGYAIAFWLPSLLQRSFGFDLMGTAQFVGVLLLIGGVPGVLWGGWFADIMARRDPAWLAWLPAAAYAASAPLFALGFASSGAMVFFWLLVPQALSYIWFGPITSAIQGLVPAGERATASALFLLINNLIGLGAGVYVLGAFSDYLQPFYGSEALRQAMLWFLVFYVIAALLLVMAGKALRQYQRVDVNVLGNR